MYLLAVFTALGTHALRGHVRRHDAPRHAALRSVGKRNDRVEVRARNGPKRENERDQSRAGRERVCQQRDRDVSAREALAHDPRTDDDGE